MNKTCYIIFKICYLFCLSLAFSACSKTEQDGNELVGTAEPIQSQNAVEDGSQQRSAEEKPQQAELKLAAEYKRVEWTDLMPKEDLDALLNPPEYLDEIQDGSEADQINGQLKNSQGTQADDPYQQALVSTKVKAEMNGQAIRIAGFVVPIEFDDEEVITQFFLVPFFGACIHVPPPPPNQIILIDAPQGLKLQALYDPFWIYGELKTVLTENDIATSAYSMRMHKYEDYIETSSGS